MPPSLYYSLPSAGSSGVELGPCTLLLYEHVVLKKVTVELGCCSVLDYYTAGFVCKLCRFLTYDFFFNFFFLYSRAEEMINYLRFVQVWTSEHAISTKPLNVPNNSKMGNVEQTNHL